MGERENKLAQFARCLNTEEGKALMEELRIAWGTGSVFTPGDPHQTSYYAGMLDCFRQVEAFQMGRNLDDEVKVNG